MEMIKTSPCWWGYSRKPKNWRQHYEDEFDLFYLIARSQPMKSRTLTDEEVRE